ncbi:nuclear transport factor 2 family protein [Isachenkonia alkalipeptolytica]|uniref:SnoaL-like domain-containing protein n=1 Tax=Isachenkonia alkalipeptolytica TaxID=2565777 RepID=A0AA44BEI9_9CLOT|nr:nuclear transport factor 2 family protein [Isachenkonia alkalipeptolytica]NBG88215.1 hypothetical protein [Isachenkonia alkalipeptolytica]
MALLSIESADKFNAVIEDYLESYFQKRDLKKIASYLAESFYGCGTGLDEQVYNKDEGLAIFKRDLETVNTPIKKIYRRREMQLLNNTTAIFQASMDVYFNVMGEEMEFQNLRMTVVLHEVDNEIKIITKHLSLPTDSHEEGESYPIKEALARKSEKINTISIKF